MHLGATDPKIMRRQQVECRIVKRIVRDALALGYAISVDNGGDDLAIEGSRDRDLILAELYETDTDVIILDGRGGGLPGGNILLVYGNDGYDAICDHHTSLEAFLAPIEADIAKWEAGR